MAKYQSSTTVRMRYIEATDKWSMLHNHLVYDSKGVGKYPTILDDIPNCEQFHKQYPGCEFDEDNVFQNININLSKGGRKMRLLPKALTKLIAESQGWTTHFNCMFGIALCVLGIAAVIVGASKAVGLIAFTALAFVFCAIGCLREKLEAMKK